MKNIGHLQRILRGVVAAALLAGAALGAAPQPWGVALAVLGIALLATAVTGWCPIFPLFGIRPMPPRNNDRPRA
ncbi:MAG: DUF2892 domain-containing protein [Acidobacteriota bacterium]|nr:DUF2892 domain-containing protein [Acidobacteriota bacterium]MDH3522504.1 DUF2892 domain-containing protein [Acidobacteriota bacterium]